MCRSAIKEDSIALKEDSTTLEEGFIILKEDSITLKESSIILKGDSTTLKESLTSHKELASNLLFVHLVAIEPTFCEGGVGLRFGTPSVLVRVVKDCLQCSIAR